VGFSCSINHTFFSRLHRLICFSRAMASEALVKRSNQTNLPQPYALVKPSNLPSRCCL
jgi:hypothetical protein